MNCFIRFCLYFGRKHLPAGQDTLRCYVAFLARTLNLSSIPGYLNVVRLLHVNAGLENPLLGNWEVTMIQRGIARKLGRPPRQKLPITIEILKDIFKLLDLELIVDGAFWIACLVCFFGLMRKSTLLPKSMNDLSGKYLLRSDVVDLGSRSFLIRVRHSKTIQYGQRVLTLPYVSCTDTRLCPVYHMLKHLTRSRLPPGDALFSYSLRGSKGGLTHSSFVGRLKVLLQKAGYSSIEYSGHSFRRGGCTFCYRAGLSITDIKLRGDWKSQSFERYLHIPASSVYKSACVLADFAVVE